MRQTSLFSRILRARKPDHIALLIRAWACWYAANTAAAFTAEQSLSNLKKMEDIADVIEQCESYQDARRLLKHYGFISKD